MNKLFITLSVFILISFESIAANNDASENYNNTITKNEITDNFYPSYSSRFNNMDFDEFFSEWSNFSNYSSGKRVNLKVSRTDKLYTVKIEIPGYDREQIKLEILDQDLILSSRENKNVNTKEDTKDDYNEIKSFKQIIRLPEDADKESISSSLKNGVMNIIVPIIPAKAKVTKEIKIN